MVVAYFNHILDLMADFCDDRSDKNVPPPVLLLLLSRWVGLISTKNHNVNLVLENIQYFKRTCKDLQANTIRYILNYVDEQFFVDDTAGGLTTCQKLSEKMKQGKLFFP